MTRRRALILVIAIVAIVGIIAVVAILNRPHGELKLSGDLAAHDPALVAGGPGQPWYVFATGSTAGDGNIQIRRSADGHEWEYLGEVWPKKPDWLVKTIPGVQNLWAPELVKHGDTWYLYYAASTFGSNHSVIGLATNTTLDPQAPGYEWVDKGPVLESQLSDDFNAIDPATIEDSHGTPWMAFGSFWSGIRMVQLAWPDGMLADPSAVPLRLADRGSPPNAIEAAYIVKHDNYFYLFASRDLCCRGVDSTYNIVVGRSSKVMGPYVDKAGVPMLENGGTQLLATAGREIGPGGQTVSNGYLAYHFYDGDQAGAFQLAIRVLDWDSAGWPVLN
jgi:arabinan endo-1,5-alpha-L-arabinosidase